MTIKNIIVKVALIVSISGIAACSGRDIVNGTVDTAGFVAKTAVNGTIGAGKLVINGVTGND